jgi:hypothetical protein
MKFKDRNELLKYVGDKKGRRVGTVGTLIDELEKTANKVLKLKEKTDPKLVSLYLKQRDAIRAGLDEAELYKSKLPACKKGSLDDTQNTKAITALASRLKKFEQITLKADACIIPHNKNLALNLAKEAVKLNLAKDAMKFKKEVLEPKIQKNARIQAQVMHLSDALMDMGHKFPQLKKTTDRLCHALVDFKISGDEHKLKKTCDTILSHKLKEPTPLLHRAHLSIVKAVNAFLKMCGVTKTNEKKEKVGFFAEPKTEMHKRIDAFKEALEKMDDIKPSTMHMHSHK